MDPRAAHAEGTNAGCCSAGDAALQQVDLRIDDLTLQENNDCRTNFHVLRLRELYRVEKSHRLHE